MKFYIGDVRKNLPKKKSRFFSTLENNIALLTLICTYVLMSAAKSNLHKDVVFGRMLSCCYEEI